jgi:hypothetical protein
MDFLFKSPESQLYGLSIFIAILVFQIAFVFVQWMFKKRDDYLFYISYMTITGLFGLSLYKDVLTFRPVLSSNTKNIVIKVNFDKVCVCQN